MSEIRTFPPEFPSSPVRSDGGAASNFRLELVPAMTRVCLTHSAVEFKA